jgi:Leucine-rich repeat (LRR) protein
MIYLDTLDLSDNMISTIPFWVTKISGLKSLDISNNLLSISDLSEEVILWLDKNDPDWKISQKKSE